MRPEIAKHRLLWSDEFNRDGAPDPRNWGYEKGFLRNKEEQYYVPDRRENARVEGGRLVIEARKDGFGGNPISSASLTTAGKRDLLYGRVEVRAKVPAGRGTWPAIWTLGRNIGEVGWPTSGEIDLMEYVNFEPNQLYFNVHTKAFNWVAGTNKGTSVPTPDAAAKFRTYALDWTPTRLTWSLDGKEVFAFEKPAGATVAEWPFDAPQYLILNLAIGGGWGGQKGVDEAIFPARFEVDWVRVYGHPKD